MSFSKENSMQAKMDVMQSMTEGTAGLWSGPPGQDTSPDFQSSPSLPPPVVHFVAHKKVGNFEFRTGGVAGQEEEAKAVLNESAAALRKGK